MSEALRALQRLAAAGNVCISEHGYDALADDGLFVRDLLNGLESAMLLEGYPLFAKGPAVQVLQFDRQHHPVHVVWGIPKGCSTPAVLVTAYRPDPARWDETLTRRRR